jgi:MarR family transcriptional regulator, transcriptional regulator for hemolysin
MDSKLFKMPAHLINRAARHLQRIGDEAYQQLGLAIAQVPVLRDLKDGEAKSQTELARLANVEQPTMAQLLARMQRDGLIERSPNPLDGRGSLVRLTAKARARLPAAGAVLLHGNRIALKGFSEREIESLTRLLARVNANLDEYRRHEAQAATA